MFRLVAQRQALVATVPAQHMYGFESTVLVAMLAGAAFDTERPFYPADIAAALGGDTLPIRSAEVYAGASPAVQVDGPLQAASAGAGAFTGSGSGTGIGSAPSTDDSIAWPVTGSCSHTVMPDSPCMPLYALACTCAWM